MADERALLAARNNADWYASMFDLHGRRYERLAGAFVATAEPPPFHSWVTITEPELGADLLARIAEMAGQQDFVVKDSFCSLDIDALRLRPFIEASWIFCSRPASVDTSRWLRIESAEDLERWELAWSDGSASPDFRQFPTALLGRAELACWGRVTDGVIDGGVIANRSDADGGGACVGMSNVFGVDATPAAAFLCSTFGEGLPVVGYDWGEALEEAQSAGFTPVGALRICERQAPAATESEK